MTAKAVPESTTNTLSECHQNGSFDAGIHWVYDPYVNWNKAQKDAYRRGWDDKRTSSFLRRRRFLTN